MSWAMTSEIKILCDMICRVSYRELYYDEFTSFLLKLD